MTSDGTNLKDKQSMDPKTHQHTPEKTLVQAIKNQPGEETKEGRNEGRNERRNEEEESPENQEQRKDDSKEEDPREAPRNGENQDDRRSGLNSKREKRRKKEKEDAPPKNLEEKIAKALKKLKSEELDIDDLRLKGSPLLAEIMEETIPYNMKLPTLPTFNGERDPRDNTSRFTATMGLFKRLRHNLVSSIPDHPHRNRSKIV
ncbi:protein MNN4-like [Mercurialis annua]|uniref:protein MNN4-like n=1 Tax=Mercurialis annua TaxID=3986 RepID=UPI00215DDEC5|nr:protein MNN4-like [Mercurialis annua]